MRAEGFSCPSCVEKVEKQLKALEGVRDATVQFATSKITVEHDSALPVDKLISEVGKAGYKARASAF